MPAENTATISNLEWEQATAQFGPWIHRRARRIARQLPTHVARNLYEDLVGVGFRGFVEAIRRLDPDRPESSEAYVRQHITGAMLDELRRLDPLSRDQRRRQRALREVERSLTRKLGRPPSEDEMVQATKISTEDYRRRVSEAVPPPLSLDAPTSWEGEPLINMVDDGQTDPQEQTLEVERRKLLIEAVGRLPSTHRMVVQRYYFKGDTLVNIGNGLNVCAARVSQIRKEAVDRIRRDVAERLAS
jgi:RNA polymerase sigma factor for flagellar operon FliA